MTQEEMIALVQQICDDNRATDELVSVYLQLAADRILNRLYPFGRGTKEFVPEEHQRLQCELAARMYLKRGGEGEIVHIENGVHRHYHSVTEEDLLGQLVPNCGVPGVTR